MKRIRKHYLIKRICGFIGTSILFIASFIFLILLTCVDLSNNLTIQIVFVILSPVFAIFGVFSLILTLEVRIREIIKDGKTITVYAGNISKYLLIDDEIVDSLNIVKEIKESTYGNMFKASDIILSYINKDYEVNVVIGMFNKIDIKIIDRNEIDRL